jgi:hypothetical protein
MIRGPRLAEKRSQVLTSQMSRVGSPEARFASRLADSWPETARHSGGTTLGPPRCLQTRAAAVVAGAWVGGLALLARRARLQRFASLPSLLPERARLELPFRICRPRRP